jgi:hypothetical protein
MQFWSVQADQAQSLANRMRVKAAAFAQLEIHAQVLFWLRPDAEALAAYRVIARLAQFGELPIIPCS